ncbi:MAG: polysaccharide deacetylase family protein, partial [Coriobacteriia bacterium]|nr:polysaccharide deacetylase family protein [Coriobacteriia bacterium]
QQVVEEITEAPEVVEPADQDTIEQILQLLLSEPTSMQEREQKSSTQGTLPATAKAVSSPYGSVGLEFQGEDSAAWSASDGSGAPYSTGGPSTHGTTGTTDASDSTGTPIAPGIAGEILSPIESVATSEVAARRQAAAARSRAAAARRQSNDAPAGQAAIVRGDVGAVSQLGQSRAYGAKSRQKSISRRAFSALAGTATLAAAGAGVAFFLRKMGYISSTTDIRSRMPGFFRQRLAGYHFPELRYAHGVYLDTSRVLLGQIGETVQIRTAVGSSRGDNHLILEEADYFSTNNAIATVDSFGNVTAQGFGICEIGVGLGNYLKYCQVQVASKWAAITFDDGPVHTTRRLLDGMRERGAHSTFFVLGNQAEGKADILQQMVADGNEIGNHTYSHNGSDSVLASQLSRTDDIIREATGRETYLMRPPEGVIYNAMYSCGKPIIYWSVDPQDWLVRNAETVYDRLMRDVYSGCVVCMHDLYETSVDAALRAMDTFIDQGYVFVTISELLGNPMPGTIYYDGDSTPRTIKYRNHQWDSLFF